MRANTIWICTDFKCIRRQRRTRAVESAARETRDRRDVRTRSFYVPAASWSRSWRRRTNASNVTINKNRGGSLNLNARFPVLQCISDYKKIHMLLIILVRPSIQIFITNIRQIIEKRVAAFWSAPELLRRHIWNFFFGHFRPKIDSFVLDLL